MTNKKLDKYKEMLIQKRERLVELHSQEHSSLMGGDSLHVDHMADSGSDTCEQSLAADLMESELSEIAEIDTALERIDEGSFGACQACGDLIGDKRLTARPASSYCIECKTKLESGELET